MDSERDIVGEERILYVALIVIGAMVIASLTIQRAALGAGGSLCLTFIALGVVGLVASLRRRHRIPHARVFRKSRQR